MYDHDAVIRHASECAASHAGEVSTALCQFVAARTMSENAQARDALRVALVAQAAGFEGVAHDGSTYQRRVDAAKAALVAWDGPADETVTIRAGSVAVRCSAMLAKAAGWETPYSTDETRTARVPMYGSERLLGHLAQALGDGLRGDAAIMRVLALRNNERAAHEAQESAKAVATINSKAAGMQLAAEREASKRAKVGE